MPVETTTVQDDRAAQIDLQAPGAASVITIAVVSAVLLTFNLLTVTVMLSLANGSSPIASGIAGPMMAFSAFGLGLAVWQMSLPRIAWLTSEHLGLENWFGCYSVRWDSITYAEQAAGALPGSKKEKVYLVLRNAAGRQLARLAGTPEVIDALHREVTSRSPAGITQPSQAPTFDKRLRRKRLMMFISSFFLLTMGIAATWMFTIEYLDQRRFENEAVAGTARIVKHYMYNVTPRLDFEVTAADGRSAQKSVAMDRGVWDMLQGEEQVPVQYVPGNPEIARVEGERTDNIPPVFMIPAGLFMLLLGAGSLLLAIKGYDLVTTDGKFRLVPLADTVARGLQDPPNAGHNPPPLPASAYASPASDHNQPTPHRGQHMPVRTPTGLRALGLITSIYGLFGGILIGLALVFIMLADTSLEESRIDESHIMFESIMQVIGGLFSLGLIIAGIGLLRSAKWSVPAARWSAWGKILVTIVLVIYTITQVQWGAVQGASPDELSQHTIDKTVGLGAVLGGLLKLVFPTMLLGLLSMPQVRSSVGRVSTIDEAHQ